MSGARVHDLVYLSMITVAEEMLPEEEESSQVAVGEQITRLSWGCNVNAIIVASLLTGGKFPGPGGGIP